MTSATLLQQARRRAGITQSELAARVGTTQSAIARWERGASHPSTERLESLVAACDLELQFALAPRDPDEIASLQRNLEMTVDDRINRVITFHRFIASGRAAMARADAER
jgi:transcriptional regulator with XRE-family HTH domain